MDWNKGFSASYFATFVDASTWRDLERFDITEGQISIDIEELRCSASLGAVRYQSGTERLVRVYLDARQNGDAQLVPLFTGYATSPSRTFNGVLETNPLDLYSVLKPVQDVILPRGWYAAAEIPCGTLIRDLLAPTPAPVEIADNSPALTDAIIAEDDESNLTMIEKILTAMDWRLRITGAGVIQILPTASEPIVAYDPIDNDAIEPNVDVSHDWYECPNCLRATAADLTAVARDDSADSMYSTVNRGREIWISETDCDLNDGETIEEYATRRLKEEQRTAVTASYQRRFYPDVFSSDLIRLHYPAQGLEGLYRVESLSITLGHGCPCEEEVSKYE